MRVAALYRFPVKGFAAEKCEALSVLEGGRIAGDRVLGIRFGNSSAADDAWSAKHGFVALVNTPGLARLHLEFNHETRRLRISLHGAVLVDAALDDAGRTRIASAIEEYVLKLDENPLNSRPDRLPLRVVGDGATSRYQDNPAGQVTLHGRQSLAAVAAAAGEPEFSELRFRSNIAVDGLEAWEEQNWIGRSVRVGEIEFEVVSEKTRCLATHANPLTGERDLPVMQMLIKVFPRKEPTFAIAMTTAGRGGVIRVGDKVQLSD
jgi:uncharacterized protein YcbX